MQTGMAGMSQESKDAMLSERYVELTGAIGESKGAAEAMAQVQLDNLAGDVTLFKSALEGELIDAAIQIIMALTLGIVDSLPILIEMLPEIIIQIVDTLIENAPKLIEAALVVIITLAEALMENLPKLIGEIPKIIFAIVDSLIEHAPELLKAAVEIVGALAIGLIDGIVTIVNCVAEWYNSIWEGITGWFDNLKELGSQVVNMVGDGIKGAISGALEWGKDLVQNFIDGIKQKWEDLKSTVSDLAGSVKDYLGFSEPKKGPLSNFHTYAPDMMQLFAAGIKENENLITDQISKSFDFSDQMINVDAKANVTAGGTDVESAGGITQNITINAPTELDPNEVARQTRNASRDMLLAARGIA
ncbi:unnamed protein product [Cylicocyclus nassatus]|uniref:Uncharacterized protein n=1 Tax=Cylicocyclus nassatus TaxID=53992 RepID=A0AA36DT41_CYLNA|nr:unnamed protein product [Cylicocyclus nassatus]